MGAQSFVVFGEGKTSKEAFEKLYKEAEKFYGENPYNGSISTTYFDGEVPNPLMKRGEKYKKENEDQAYEYCMEKVLDLDRHKCKALNIGVLSYYNEVTRRVNKKRPKEDSFKEVYKFAFYGWGSV